MTAQRGFSLIEILVAVAILSVLAAIALPVYQSAIESGRIVQSTQNLRSLAAANVAYAADHGTYCPADHRNNNLRWHGARNAGGDFDATAGLLSPYLGHSQRVTLCPLLEPFIDNVSSFEDGSGGYGYNSTYVGGKPGGGYSKSTGLRIAERPGNIEEPSNTVMFATTAYARSEGVQEYPYADPPYWDFGGGPSGFRPSPTVHFRAGGRALVAWCDGHVSTETREDRAEGSNPHGGNADEQNLGWFGPDENNGYWNSRKR